MRPLYGYWGVFFLRGVGNEVVLCVSTLMLVARGLSLSEIAFILMLGFAATTILEIPSGMAGDLWGKKTSVGSFCSVQLGVAFCLFDRMETVDCAGSVSKWRRCCLGLGRHGCALCGTVDGAFR